MKCTTLILIALVSTSVAAQRQPMSTEWKEKKDREFLGLVMGNVFLAGGCLAEHLWHSDAAANEKGMRTPDLFVGLGFVLMIESFIPEKNKGRRIDADYNEQTGYHTSR